MKQTNQSTALSCQFITKKLLESISRYPRFGANTQTRRLALTDWLSYQLDIRVVKSRAVPGTTEGGAPIILDVYRAPQRPSDAAMCGFSRRISQSGKSPHQPPPSFSSLPEGFITLVVAQKKCTAQIALIVNSLTNRPFCAKIRGN
jgi:hypothetical protein